MRKRTGGSGDAAQNQSGPHRVRLPGFISEEDIGLGEIVQRVTHTLGIKPCGGCKRRAAALNRWVVFTGPRK
jgi:hypothetical protein